MNLSASLVPSIDRFLKVWDIMHLCPKQFSAPPQVLSLNTLTLGLAVAIFIVARSTVAGSQSGISGDILAMAVATIISFATGYVTLIFVRGQAGIQLAQKWSQFFVLLWLTSLMLIIALDGIPVWTHTKPLSSALIDLIYVPGSLTAIEKDTIRAAFLYNFGAHGFFYKNDFY